MRVHMRVATHALLMSSSRCLLVIEVLSGTAMISMRYRCHNTNTVMLTPQFALNIGVAYSHAVTLSCRRQAPLFAAGPWLEAKPSSYLLSGFGLWATAPHFFPETTMIVRVHILICDGLAMLACAGDSSSTLTSTTVPCPVAYRNDARAGTNESNTPTTLLLRPVTGVVAQFAQPVDE